MACPGKLILFGFASRGFVVLILLQMHVHRVNILCEISRFFPARRSKRGICYGNVAGWVGGWLGVCHTPALNQNG